MSSNLIGKASLIEIPAVIGLAEVIPAVAVGELTLVTLNKYSPGSNWNSCHEDVYLPTNLLVLSSSLVNDWTSVELIEKSIFWVWVLLSFNTNLTALWSGP